MSDSLWMHGLQHTSLPCPPLSLGVCWSSCPLSRWCYLTVSCSAAAFSFCLQFSSTSGSFSLRWLFVSGGQSIGAAASASVLLMNILRWFPLGLTGLILLFKGLSSVFSNNHSSKASILRCLALFMVQLSHPYLTTGKNRALTKWVGATDKIPCLLMAFIWFAKSPSSWSSGLKCKMGSCYKSTSGVDCVKDTQRTSLKGKLSYCKAKNHTQQYFSLHSLYTWLLSGMFSCGENPWCSGIYFWNYFVLQSNRLISH